LCLGPQQLFDDWTCYDDDFRRINPEHVKPLNTSKAVKKMQSESRIAVPAKSGMSTRKAAHTKLGRQSFEKSYDRCKIEQHEKHDLERKQWQRLTIWQ